LPGSGVHKLFGSREKTGNVLQKTPIKVKALKNMINDIMMIWRSRFAGYPV
jgi:hypothetical protein